jgi:hypothetical protein
MKNKKTQTNGFIKERDALIASILPEELVSVCDCRKKTSRRSEKKERDLLDVAYDMARGFHGIVHIHESKERGAKTVADTLSKMRNTRLLDLSVCNKSKLLGVIQKITRRDVLVVGSFENATLYLMDILAGINDKWGIGIILVSEHAPAHDGPEWQALLSRLSYQTKV